MTVEVKEMRVGVPSSSASENADLPILHLRGIAKHFGGVQALNGAEFALYRQEIVAIVGDNGAGKSTMVKIISGVHPPDSGEILMSGNRVTMQSPLRARNLGIETVFQDLALVNTTDVVSNLFLGREITRRPFGWVLDKKRMTEQAREILGRLKISIPDLHAPVGQLSGGQRQAVAVCRAVTWGTKIVLMDEPTAALGVNESRKVLDLILRMKELGISVVIVVHNLEHVFSVADRIVVMRGGSVVGAFKHSETSREAIVGMITGAAA